MAYISNNAIKEIREKVDRILFDIEYIKQHLEERNDKNNK